MFCFIFLLKKLHFDSCNTKIIRTSHIFLINSLETDITVAGFDFTCTDCWLSDFSWIFLHYYVVILSMGPNFFFLLDFTQSSIHEARPEVTKLMQGSLSFQTNRPKRKNVLKTMQEKLLRDMKLQQQVGRAFISKCPARTHSTEQVS